MPLSKAAARKMLHIREISMHGYEREDGLFDIEAHITDKKTISFDNRDRGGIAAGEPIHDMWMRLTLSRDMTIMNCEATMDSTPYLFCPGAAPNYQRLAGLTIGKGFIKAAMQRLSMVEGCTHLRELLQQIGTAAFQTMAGGRPPGSQDAAKPAKGIPPRLLNSCYSYNENGPLAARYRDEASAE